MHVSIRCIWMVSTPRGMQVLPFPQYELQARWVARVLSGRVSLPSPAQMEVCHIATASTCTTAETLV